MISGDRQAEGTYSITRAQGCASLAIEFVRGIRPSTRNSQGDNSRGQPTVVAVLNSNLSASLSKMSGLRKLEALQRAVGETLEAGWLTSVFDKYADALSRTWAPLLEMLPLLLYKLRREGEFLNSPDMACLAVAQHTSTDQFQGYRSVRIISQSRLWTPGQPRKASGRHLDTFHTDLVCRHLQCSPKPCCV